MTRIPLRARALAVVLGLLLWPAASSAQKALIYCPVGIDDTGCVTATAALAGAFPDGVDRAFDGASGTLDLATVDFAPYAVFLVPSLADDIGSQPYARLRDAAIAARLRAALTGRFAFWSGTPDQGSTNRAQKDILLRNLASFAGANHAAVQGPGLVVLQDHSADAAQRYAWVEGLTSFRVVADGALQAYSSVRALTPTATTILDNAGTPLAYANMASFGFQLPAGGSGVSLDAVGNTGTSTGGQVVLLTAQPASVGPRIWSDKDDYAPGETVTLFGTGFQAGETVSIVLHEDPQMHADVTLTATADADGAFVNTDFAPDEHDIGVRFVVTATGQTSGLVAQTTFTDANITNNLDVSPSPVSVSQGNSALFTVTVSFGGNPTPCTAPLSVIAGLPAGATATFVPPSVTGASNDTPKTSSLTVTTTGPGPGATPTGTYTLTVQAATGTGCTGAARTDNATLIVTAPTNTAPILNAIGNKSVDEHGALSFTATATDAQSPPQTLTFNLIGAPAGATINASTGAFSWTPGENDGGNDFTFMVRVTDDGSGNLFDEEEITVTVNEVNQAPVLGAIGNKSVNELAELTFTATATDGDIPANGLTFSLDGAPAGASIDPVSGAFSWTPAEPDGPGSFTFTVRVTDDGSPNLSDEEQITVTVNEVNVAPVLDPVGNQTVDEETLLSFTATATDADVPPNMLTFSLGGTVPAGASITSGGAFSWTPTEAQGPDSHMFDVCVTDNGTPALRTCETITVTVNEVNVAAVWTTIGDRNVDELALLSFTVEATDADVPPNALTYSVVGMLPAGADFNTTTRTFSWTPTEAQGPGSYPVTLRVNDGTVDVDESFTITVNEVNVAPVLDPVGNQTVDEETLLSFTATATDADVPANTLTFSLGGSVPAGAAITSAGAFTWTPTEAQGPGSYTFDVCVADNGSPVLSDCETITVTVNEVNVAPVLAGIGDKTVDELTALTFTASATDADLPANTLTFSLVSAPAGASIDPNTGAFSWTPAEADGPGSFTFTVRVQDDGTPSLSDEETITVTVNEVNQAPELGAIGNRTVDELVALTFTATATDSDLPPNTLTFSLDGAPAGATIDGTTGAFSWTPTEAQGPGSYTFDVCVTDSGSPTLDDCETITVTVNEVNVAPVLGMIGNKTGTEGSPIQFTAAATDADIPSNTLTFSLIGAPAGATIDGASGAFSWTPANDGSFTLTVRVTDDGTGNLYDEEQITIDVSNVAPVVGPITVLVNNVVNPTPVIGLGTPISVKADFTDAGTGDTHTAVVHWGDGTTSAGTVTETNGSGMVTATRTYGSAGVYRVRITVNDDDTSTDSPDFEYIVVYDPSAGFVTGGGWIDSPAGACRTATCTDQTTGKANFGFVSKYKKGANVPEGNTEFQFQAGGLNFHSTSYQWLVVAGSKAQFKGEGRVNGTAGYGFMLTANDGDKKPDTFRMKIWVLGDETNIIYDNQMAGTDTDDPVTTLGGGSIVVHSK